MRSETQHSQISVLPAAAGVPNQSRSFSTRSVFAKMREEIWLLGSARPSAGSYGVSEPLGYSIQLQAA